MAYFSNGSEASVFDDQCARCKFGDKPCPIAFVQTNYNYEACNNETARKILDELVKEDGICIVFEMAKTDFQINHNQITLEL